MEWVPIWTNSVELQIWRGFYVQEDDFGLTSP